MFTGNSLTNVSVSPAVERRPRYCQTHAHESTYPGELSSNSQPPVRSSFLGFLRLKSDDLDSTLMRVANHFVFVPDIITSVGNFFTVAFSCLRSLKSPVLRV